MYRYMDPRRVKEGDVMKYKTGFLSNKWKTYHAVLFSDSKFCWYDEKGDTKPKGCVLLKDVVPYICVGLMTDRMPVKSPTLPDGYSKHHLVGIGMDPRAETVHWILFSSDADMESWVTEITKTLPIVNPQPQPQPAPPGGVPAQPSSGGYVPPAKYPDAPPPVQPTQPYPQPVPVGGGAPMGGGGAPPPPYYSQGSGGYGGGGPPPAPGPTTVIIDRGGGGYGGGYGGGGLGGFGSGLLGFGTGMLAGSLMSHGLGSMWGGHGMVYGGGMGGMGGGLGSYYSDNDTNITNNYYNYDPNSSTGGGAIDSTSSQPAITEVPNDIGGGDLGGYDYPGDTGPGGAGQEMGFGTWEKASMPITIVIIKPPDLPNGYAVDHLVGIGMDLDAETVHWILFSSDEEIDAHPQVQPAYLYPATPISDDEPSKVGGKGLLGFGSAILAGSLASYGFGSMWESDNVRELGYHSVSFILEDYNGDFGGGDYSGGDFVIRNSVGVHDDAFNKSFGTSMLTEALVSHGLGSMWGQGGGSYHLAGNSVDKHHYDRIGAGKLDNPTAVQAARSEVRGDEGLDHSGGHGGFDYPGVNFHSGDLGGGDHSDGFLSSGDFGDNDFDHFDSY
ncbi:unnamed protein product [Cylicocyclus nassatus]|uniref:PH domain-containing protein n=1 Tax=Cylicocyclus nassatus TaxID=53992 RepID=A0AA36GJR0_CYLNA|nr:unnamed protein product [Cylicocyclus nassatus]